MKNLVEMGTKIFLSAFLTIFSLSAVPAQIFTGDGFTIVDGGGRVAAGCDTIAVSGVTSNRVVRSVSITGTHSWIGDTEVRLYPPGAAPPPSRALPSQIIASPPDGRACNYSGTYRFIDTAAQSIDAATVGCTDATNVAPGDYRTSNYGGGVNPGTVTSLSTMFGSLTPAQANGDWLVCVFDLAAPDGGTITSTALQFTVLTAASVSVSGRVARADGSGIPKANVTITNSAGISRTVITSPFGYYMFDEVSVGETYTVTSTRKGIDFQQPSQVIFVEENMDNVNFTANPGSATK